MGICQTHVVHGESSRAVRLWGIQYNLSHDTVMPAPTCCLIRVREAMSRSLRNRNEDSRCSLTVLRTAGWRSLPQSRQSWAARASVSRLSCTSKDLRRELPTGSMGWSGLGPSAPQMPSSHCPNLLPALPLVMRLRQGRPPACTTAVQLATMALQACCVLSMQGPLGVSTLMKTFNA